MAIDTARKRASAMGFNTMESFIIPHGEIDAFDRATLMGCYGGIPVQSPQVRGEWRLNPAGVDNWVKNPDGTSDWTNNPAGPNYWAEE